MRRFAWVVSLLACTAFADGVDRHALARLTRAGDLAFAKNELPEAEAAYRAALRPSTAGDVDVNASRLAVLLNHQGRCSGGDADVDTLMQVLRGDFAAAKPALEANATRAPASGCWNTVMLQALVLAYRAEGRVDEARRLAEKASTQRCKALVDDTLENALASLVLTEQLPDRREALRASAAKVLGEQSALLGQGSPGRCSDAVNPRLLADAGDRAFARKQYAEAERWYRQALKRSQSKGTDLDANLSALASALLAQGKCVTGDATLDALIALHRGDVAGTRLLAADPSTPGQATLWTEAHAFTLWLDGRVDEARAVMKPRELRARPDHLEVGLRYLNLAWSQPDERDANQQLALEHLGMGHPLFSLYLAKRDGRQLPAPAACRARR